MENMYRFEELGTQSTLNRLYIESKDYDDICRDHAEVLKGAKQNDPPNLCCPASFHVMLPPGLAHCGCAAAWEPPDTQRKGCLFGLLRKHKLREQK